MSDSDKSQRKKQAGSGDREGQGWLCFKLSSEGRLSGGGGYLNRDLNEVKEQPVCIWGVPGRGNRGANILKLVEAWHTKL